MMIDQEGLRFETTSNLEDEEDIRITTEDNVKIYKKLIFHKVTLILSPLSSQPSIHSW